MAFWKLPERISGHGIRRRLKRRFSPLTLRIMAVNVLALAILLGAILYLSRYQDRLIEVELAALTNEANIFASAIAEGASTQNESEVDRLVPFLARQMVRRLDEVTNARTRLYSAEGKLLADNWIVGTEAREQVVRVKLRGDGMDVMGDLARAGGRVLKYLTPGDRHWPDYVQEDDRGPPRRAEIQTALDGTTASQIYVTPRERHLIFSVAVPVQRYKQVLGAMNLTRSGESVERAISSVRMDILKLFIISLAITVLLSLYLAQAIANPIKRLAGAADRVRHGQNSQGNARRQEIPDFTSRNDEIGELSGALRGMTSALWQRMDAIESFAADVSHELKNPLASMRSAVETMGKVKDPALQEKLLGIIQYDVIRLDRLITDISSASRLDAELSRVELEPLDIGKMLGALADMYSHVDHGCQVVLEPVKGSLMVRAVEGRLMQVLQNLMDNALSFSPPNCTVRITGQRVDQLVRITVEDDGPGIPEGKLQAIFDRFYTERPAGETFGQHSGLGLSISQQIIDAHNGRITAANRTDGDRIIGAVFTVDLPAA